MFSESPYSSSSAFNAPHVIAIDLGTSTLQGRLVRSPGKILSEASLENPQVECAVDILTRLEQAYNGQGVKLQSLLIEGIRTLVKKLVAAANISLDDVSAIVAAGNPGMSCLLCKTPVESLLFPPHKPANKDVVHLQSSEIDLSLSCPLTVFPQVSGFVGGDLVACLLGLDNVAPGTVLIDLGTNAEIALWGGRRWWVTSAAAGPAFEGGNITSGMIHTKGAVTDVRLDGDRLRLNACGEVKPRGLCGSGLLSLVAAALDGGIVDASGTILSENEVETNLGRYLVENKNSRAIRYYRDAETELHLTQDDVRNLQLAKGAVRAGVAVLLEKSGFSPQQVPHVYLTGALGINVSKTALKRVALLPEPMVDKTSFIPNGVLKGLQVYLASNRKESILDNLVKSMQPFPLSGTPAFEKYFMKSLSF